MREIIENNRIVGGTTANTTNIIADFYRDFVEGEVLETDAKTAEMAKLTEMNFTISTKTLKHISYLEFIGFLMAITNIKLEYLFSRYKFVMML